jgi:hypothetical protein
MFVSIVYKQCLETLFANNVRLGLYSPYRTDGDIFWSDWLTGCYVIQVLEVSHEFLWNRETTELSDRILMRALSYNQ